MRYNIVRNWIDSFDLMTKKSFVTVPFIIWGFLEILALIFIYFSTGTPFMHITNPLIKKFFGEVFLHYPANLFIMPTLYYYANLLIFAAIGVFLSAVTIDLVGKVDAQTPLKTRSMLEEALRRYGPCLVYAILIVLVGVLVRNLHAFGFGKVLRYFSRHLPQIAWDMMPFISALSLLVLRIAFYAFLILTIPIIVIKKKPFIKALGESAFKGLLNFFAIFTLLLVPYLICSPVLLVKIFYKELMEATFVEMVFFVTLGGIVIIKLVECYTTICITRFLLDKERLTKEG
ncbi:MAG: hypothetical protein ISS34_03990 [Candidatus Omnitrophica bacterium]|nr:hypothetical protein [Candidatus Omnitrophota bacterium]